MKPRFRSFLRRPLLVTWLLSQALAGAAPVSGSFPAREEILAGVYPGASIRSERLFLTEEQRDRAARLAGVEIPSRLIARYTAFSQSGILGRAYVDTHVVRTKKESLLICLDDQGRVKRIEVTAFLEPPEYQASTTWLGQYRERTLNNDLQLQRAIRPIAGATLTARAATEAVRRVLAIDEVLSGSGKSEPPS